MENQRLAFLLGLIYGFVLLFLTGVALWDVKNIVTDYMINNRVTTVSVKEISSNYPFLSNRTKVCLFYDEPWYPASIPGLGSKGRYGQYEPYELLSHILRKSDFPWSKNRLINKSLTLEDIFYIGTFLHFVRLVDDTGPIGLYSLILTLANVNTTDLNVANTIDSFILHPDTVRMVRDASDYLKPLFLTPAGMQHREAVFDLFYDPNQVVVCFRMSWYDDVLLKEQQVDHIYFFDSVQPTDRNVTKSVAATGMTVQMFGETVLPITQFSNNATDAYFVDVSVFNNGVYDSHNFQPCTLFETEQECKDDIFRRTISEICKCTMFTEAANLVLLGDSAQKSSEFCTIEIYKRCWDRAYEESQKRLQEAASTQACKPCVLYKNTYKITGPSRDNTYYTRYGRIQLDVTCSDQKLFYFEDREQYGISQLISQIGGDLGLYIGFSMISILELFLFAYHTYQKSHQFQHKSLVDWFKACTRYIARNYQSMLNREDHGKLTKDLAALAVKVRRIEEHNQKRFGDLEQKMDKIMKI